MTEPRHIYHHGVPIKPNVNEDGSFNFWTVGSGAEKFYHLEDAKAVAEHRAKRKVR